MNMNIMNKVIVEDAIFEGAHVRIILSRYDNGKTYQIHTDQFDSEMGIYVPYGVHTCNFPGMLEDDEVAIKEYSEGMGSLAFLFAYDIVDHPHKMIQTEFTTLPVCKLLV